MKKPLNLLLSIVALGLLWLAIFYWVTPAQSLPHWLPGYEAGVTQVHVKHGIASLLLALGICAVLWFTTGGKSKKPSAGPDTMPPTAA